MSPRHVAGELPGTVRIRLAGELTDVETAAALITDYEGAGLDVLEQSSLRRNRRDAGVRVYLTIRITGASARVKTGRRCEQCGSTEQITVGGCMICARCGAVAR